MTHMTKHGASKASWSICIRARNISTHLDTAFCVSAVLPTNSLINFVGDFAKSRKSVIIIRYLVL